MKAHCHKHAEFTSDCQACEWAVYWAWQREWCYRHFGRWPAVSLVGDRRHGVVIRTTGNPHRQAQMKALNLRRKDGH